MPVLADLGLNVHSEVLSLFSALLVLLQDSLVSSAGSHTISDLVMKVRIKSCGESADGGLHAD